MPSGAFALRFQLSTLNSQLSTFFSSEYQIDGHDGEQAAAHDQRVVLHPARLRSTEEAESRLERVRQAVDQAVDDVLIEERGEPGRGDRGVPGPVDGPIHDRRVEVPEEPSSTLGEPFDDGAVVELVHVILVKDRPGDAGPGLRDLLRWLAGALAVPADGDQDAGGCDRDGGAHQEELE